MNEKFCILIKISLKFVPKGPIDNKPPMALIMAWRRIGDKPLSEPMLTRFTDGYINAALGEMSYKGSTTESIFEIMASDINLWNDFEI